MADQPRRQTQIQNRAPAGRGASRPAAPATRLSGTPVTQHGASAEFDSKACDGPCPTRGLGSQGSLRRRVRGISSWTPIGDSVRARHTTGTLQSPTTQQKTTTRRLLRCCRAERAGGKYVAASARAECLARVQHRTRARRARFACSLAVTMRSQKLTAHLVWARALALAWAQPHRRRPHRRGAWGARWPSPPRTSPSAALSPTPALP